MICPIKFLLPLEVVEEAADMEALASCIESECAWWDKNMESCCILSLSARLTEFSLAAVDYTEDGGVVSGLQVDGLGF